MGKFLLISTLFFSLSKAWAEHPLEGYWNGPSTWTIVEKFEGQYLMDFVEDHSSYANLKIGEKTVYVNSEKFDRCNEGKGLCQNKKLVGGLTDKALYYEIEKNYPDEEYDKALCKTWLTINKISSGIQYEEKSNCLYDSDLAKPFIYNSTYQGNLTKEMSLRKK